MQSCEDSLNKLMTSVNQTLVESSRFFRTPGSPQSRAQLKRTLPAANDDFQAALDQLCERIYLAKAVLERDYASVATDTVSLRNMNRSLALTHHPQPDDVVEAKGQSIPDTTTTATDSIQPVKAEGGVAAENKDQNVPADSQDRANSQAALPAPAAAPAATTGATPVVSTISMPGVKGIPKADNESPTSKHTISMPSVNAAHESEAGAGNERRWDAAGNDGRSGLDAFDSLLPGLESYANSGAEGNNVAVQHPKSHADNNSKSGDQQPDTAAGQEGPADVVMEDMPPPESNFDDLFVGIGDLGDGEGLLNNVEIGELDDSWFT